jgi:heptaprenyl diphosphate synthase
MIAQGSPSLEAARELIREDLERSWELLCLQSDTAPGELANRMRFLSARQGKRIRSTLLFLVSRLSETPDTPSAQLSAAAIELLHVASLAHDDVIDDSDLRRGEASAPSRWGNQMAVLVGDYAFARSMRLAIDTRRPEIVDSINQASCQLTAGEVAELDLSRSATASWSLYRDVIHLKTASLLECCCRCGAISAGLDASQTEAAARFGHRFGMAFQMCDDLLDLGAVADLDKPARTDLSNGLLNLPALLLRELVGKELSEFAQLSTPELLTALREAGVLGKARRILHAELDAAKSELSILPDLPARFHLASLLEDLRERAIEAMGG